MTAKSARTSHGLHSLAASLVPGAGFVTALWSARDQDRYACAASIATWPWELWLIALAGTVATLAGVADWLYHRRQGVGLSDAERRGELIALATGGVPLFGLMLVASTLARPQVLLLPVLVVAGWTTAWVCYDEFVFHRRRCRDLEHALHRTLLAGHGLAWLAWCHWCFVRDGVTA